MTESNMQNLDAMTIDIVSDVACPWCIIGYKQLEKALDDTQTNAMIRWHPFELNPNMTAEGENLREHLAAKYGTTLEGSIKARARLTALGEELGFQFNYADDMRMYNTFKAHQLLHWAGEFGLQHQLKLALFAEFFTHRHDVNDDTILADAAQSVGLDRSEALSVLSSQTYADDVRKEQQFWISRGVQGVPAMIFNEKYLLSGAQGIDNYVNVIEQLNREKAA